MKEFVSPFDYAHVITNALQSGLLLTSVTGGKPNTMSISWGTLGIQWGKPIFTVFVRGCRHTKSMLDENPEFTVNIPLDGCDPEIIRFCGTQSGRDVDKFAALGLTAEPPEVISVPGIRQLPLTLECRVLYRQQQVPESFLDETVRGIYPAEPGNIHDDFHTAYYAQILSAYIIR